MHDIDYVKQFIAYYDYPEEAVNEILKVQQALDTNKDLGDLFDGLMNALKKNLISFRQVDQTLEDLDGKWGIDYRTLIFVFLINATKWVKEMYAFRGVPEQAFFDIFDDFKWKLQECHQVEHAWGTFVAGWFARHLEMRIFRCGRFQYELSEYWRDEDYEGPEGIVITKGTPMLDMHIPSSGIPLTDEVRLDSLKQAYAFFKDRFPDGIMKVQCGSWLLFPKHREFLPEKSNILKFMDDFDIITENEHESFHDDWRVFYDCTDLPLEQWYENTALQRAYKKWLLEGNKTGSGFGIILFDGEKILRK